MAEQFATQAALQRIMAETIFLMMTTAQPPPVLASPDPAPQAQAKAKAKAKVKAKATATAKANGRGKDEDKNHRKDHDENPRGHRKGDKRLPGGSGGGGGRFLRGKRAV